MTTKVITLIIETVEEDLSAVLAAAINELHTIGHTVKEVRVTDDSGETKVPINTVPGVTVPSPAEVEAEETATPPADVPSDPNAPVQQIPDPLAGTSSSPVVPPPADTTQTVNTPDHSDPLA